MGLRVGDLGGVSRCGAASGVGGFTGELEARCSVRS